MTMNHARAVLFVLLAFPGAALAQPRAQVSDARERLLEGALGDLSLSLTPRYEHVFDTDLRDSKGSVQIHRAGAELKVGGPLFERARWGLDTSYDVSWYDFNDTTDLIPSGKNPFQEVHQLRFTPTIAYQIDNNWSVLGGGILQFAGERDADWADAATYGGFFAANYKVSDSLALSFGARVVSQLEADASFIPLIGVTWQINDKVSLSTRGPRVELAAKVAEPITFRIFGAFDSRDYRLADDAAIPEGVVRDRRARVGAGIDWRPSGWSTLSIEGGVDVYQRFYFDDKDGNRVGADRTKPAPYLGVSFDIRF